MPQRRRRPSNIARRTTLAFLLTGLCSQSLRAEEPTELKLRAPINSTIEIRSAARIWLREPDPEPDAKIAAKPPAPQADKAQLAESAAPVGPPPANGDTTESAAAQPENRVAAKPLSPAADRRDAGQTSPAPVGTPSPPTRQPVPRSDVDSVPARSSEGDNELFRPPSAATPPPTVTQRAPAPATQPDATQPDATQPDATQPDIDEGWVAREAINAIAPLTDPGATAPPPTASPAQSPPRPERPQSAPKDQSSRVPSAELGPGALTPSDPPSLRPIPADGWISRDDLMSTPPAEQKTPSNAAADPANAPSVTDPATPSPTAPSEQKPAAVTKDRVPVTKDRTTDQVPESKQPAAPTEPPEASSAEPVAPDSNAQNRSAIPIRNLRIGRDGSLAEDSLRDSATVPSRDSSAGEQLESSSAPAVDVAPDPSPAADDAAAQGPTSSPAPRVAERSAGAKPGRAPATSADSAPRADAPRLQDTRIGDLSADVELGYTGRPAEPIELNNTVRRLEPTMRQCLQYYFARPENANERSHWGMLHSIMVYGKETRIIAGRRNYSAIAWMAGNQVCRGKRIFTTGRHGIEANEGVGLQGHQAQLLAVFALAGVPVDYPLYVDRQAYSVADLIEAEAAACRDGAELTFTLIALSHYLGTDDAWTAEGGQEWDFERLIREELAQPIVGTACGGTHRLMGFAHALRKRRAEGRPITGQWQRAEQYLQDFVEYTYQMQNRDGSMGTAWYEHREDNGDLDRKIQTTGHMVEWLLTVTPDSELQDPRLVRSIHFLLSSMYGQRNNDWSIGPKGHALRSLAMYYERVYGRGPAWEQQSSSRSSGGRR